MRTAKRRAFTMIELLVTMGILVLVASLTIVTYSKVMKTADRTRIGYQFQSIAAALEAYKTDFNSFPVTSLDDAEVLASGTPYDDEVNRDRFRGARTLCKALMGATPQGNTTAATPFFNVARANQDGADGFGFRVPSRSGVWKTESGNTDATKNLTGKVYGPYLAPDKFRVSRTGTAPPLAGPLWLDPANGAAGIKYDDTTVLLDANDCPVLYYPVLNPQPTVALAEAFIGDKGPTRTNAAKPLPMYRSGDNSQWLSAANFLTLMGDKDGNGAIGPGETAAVRGKYVLLSPGPDGFYGPNANDQTKTSAEKAAKLDDVTNIE